MNFLSALIPLAKLMLVPSLYSVIGFPSLARVKITNAVYLL